MNIPESLRYTKNHEWIKTEGDIRIIGITEYAQAELGDIVFVEIETEGEQLLKGAIFGSIEAVKTVSDLFMPAAGEIIAVNELINESPELINNDPFGEGWLIKIKLTDPSQMDELLDAGQYKDLIDS